VLCRVVTHYAGPGGTHDYMLPLRYLACRASPSGTRYRIIFYDQVCRSIQLSHILIVIAARTAFISNGDVVTQLYNTLTDAHISSGRTESAMQYPGSLALV
jgi:hypothetical protein